MIPKATIRTFIRYARELGAFETKLIEASSIVTAPWVRLKCRYGCGGYNTSLCCPPHTPTYLETREVIASYKYAILVRCKEVSSSTAIVGEMERRIFLAGLYKAFGPGKRAMPFVREMYYQRVYPHRAGASLHGSLRHRRLCHGSG